MKQIENGHDPSTMASALEQLCDAFAVLNDRASCAAFLEDLCTPSELEALTDRWRVVPLLMDKVPYRRIHDLTGVSVTTIGRVARFLESGNDGYRTAYERLREKS